MRAFLALILLCVFAFGSTLKIATYNVENLFDGIDNGNEYPDFRIEKGKWSKQKASQKISRIREVLNALDADIIALQEIENKQILKELAKGTKYTYATFAITKNAPIGLGVLSKIRPEDSERFAVAGVKTRDILRLGFRLDNERFELFVVHFPAYKRNGFKAQKHAEITLKTALGERKNVIVLGDFNTPFGSGKTNLLYDIMATKKYTNLWNELAYKERYSFAAYGKKRAIDHILLSREFLTNGKLVYVCDSFNVFKPDFMMDGEFVKRYDKSSLYSDHLPLFFEISTDIKQRCGIIDKILKFR
ncbi:endonuclease/exonuclease/phosphatase family protein [Campylobacter sp. 9BO]|uniref:endonuclease/exonuclease/phosphatase family protein n=1 Tax=Campylobacter sp. 9BO TaxID=3424759 RepID=UPI003D32C07A